MPTDRRVNRRQYLTTLGAGGAVALAGCSGGSEGGSDGSESSSESGDESGSGEEETMTAEEDSAESQETVTIGSDIPYAPFEYRNEAGELVGFDVDIAEAVFAGELGLEYEFQETAFDGIIASLNNANFRIIMSAMTINETRAEEVDFSDPYFTAYQTVLVLDDGEITERADLRGVDVGVQRGTTGEAAAEDLQAEFDGELGIESYDQITGAFQQPGVGRHQRQHGERGVRRRKRRCGVPRGRRRRRRPGKRSRLPHAHDRRVRDRLPAGR